MNQALEAIVTQELDALGFELFELRRGGTRGRPVLDVRIDRRDGEKVTVDDCVAASRAIEARLDAADVMGGLYVLEVSSPGMERPLRHAADWRRFTGRKISMTVGKAFAVEGGAGGGAQESPARPATFEADILAVEGDTGREIVVVKDTRGSELRVPLAGVTSARLVFDWKRGS